MDGGFLDLWPKLVCFSWYILNKNSPSTILARDLLVLYLICLLPRTPDLSLYRTDAKASRYIIYSLLASRYFIQGKTNLTLQALNAMVVQDLNCLMRDGLPTSSGAARATMSSIGLLCFANIRKQLGFFLSGAAEDRYYFIPIAFRGDLKYLTQAFSFTRHPSSEQAAALAVGSIFVWG